MEQEWSRNGELSGLGNVSVVIDIPTVVKLY